MKYNVKPYTFNSSNQNLCKEVIPEGYIDIVINFTEDISLPLFYCKEDNISEVINDFNKEIKTLEDLYKHFTLDLLFFLRNHKSKVRSLVLCILEYCLIHNVKVKRIGNNLVKYPFYIPNQFKMVYC